MRKLLKILPHIILALGVSVLLWFLLVTITGCEVLKSKRDARVDSTAISKIDSGSLRVLKMASNDSTTWYREIFEFLANKPSGDTTIVIQPNVTTPIRIIREGGTQVVSEKKEETESTWRNRYDSLMYHKMTEEKGKEANFGTQWYIWLMAGAIVLIAFKLFFKLK